jgi:hypothetical protein
MTSLLAEIYATLPNIRIRICENNAKKIAAHARNCR